MYFFSNDTNRSFFSLFTWDVSSLSRRQKTQWVTTTTVWASAFFQRYPINSKLVAQFSVAIFTSCRLPYSSLPIFPKWLPKFPLPFYRLPNFPRPKFPLPFFSVALFSFALFTVNHLHGCSRLDWQYQQATHVTRIRSSTVWRRIFTWTIAC